MTGAELLTALSGYGEVRKDCPRTTCCRFTLLRPVSFIMTTVLLLCVGCTPSPVYTSKGWKGSRSSERPIQPQETESTPGKSVNGNIGAESNKFHTSQVLKGVSSYYGPGFHGKLTANGETYNQNSLTCAHKTLPFGTVLKVRLLETGRTVKVRVNDRGPYIEGRFLDLSVEAARRIGLIKHGTGEVTAIIIRLGGH